MKAPQATPPTVALIDTRWGGHHPTYLREFTASLLRVGARVLLLCREPDEIIAALPDAPFGDLTRHVSGHRFIHRNHGILDPHRDNDPASTMLRWQASGQALAAAEHASGWHADLVYFCYLDSYLRFAPFPGYPEFFLGRPWSGLYFRNAHLGESHDSFTAPLHRAAKGDRLLRSPSCRAVCVLDERFNDILDAYCHGPVIPFPDITDESLAAKPTRAARQIIDRAAGRKIIGLISMEKRKGLLTLLRAALRAGEQREPWFFVATGPFPRETFSTTEQAFLDEVSARISSGEIDNIHFDTSGDRIPDGAPYNSIFSSFDLVWAAYEGFQGSSNALTKAAGFRIPVVATAGECIGARVDSYQLGRSFSQGDVAASLEAIRGALAGIAADGSPLTPAFETYHRLNSRDRLDEIFGHLLGLNPAPARPAIGRTRRPMPAAHAGTSS